MPALSARLLCSEGRHLGSADLHKGIALTQMGRTEEAIAAWEEVLRHHPSDPQLAGLPGQIDALRAAPGT